VEFSRFRAPGARAMGRLLRLLTVDALTYFIQPFEYASQCQRPWEAGRPLSKVDCFGWLRCARFFQGRRFELVDELRAARFCRSRATELSYASVKLGIVRRLRLRSGASAPRKFPHLFPKGSFKRVSHFTRE
jgi:hypothetical protein